MTNADWLEQRQDWLEELAAVGVAEMQRRLADRAAALVGTRYRHQGRIPARGIDCLGLGHFALRGIAYVPRAPEIFDRSNYKAEADDDDLIQAIQAEAAAVAMPPQLGDVLLFRWPGQEHAGHLGMVSRVVQGDAIFAHACIAHRRVTEQPLIDEWANRLVAVYRLRDFLELQI